MSTARDTILAVYGEFMRTDPDWSDWEPAAEEFAFADALVRRLTEAGYTLEDTCHDCGQPTAHGCDTENLRT